MSKVFVMDEMNESGKHWITINGNHVLINGEGEVIGGLGGSLKGVKLSKATSSMKGGKFKDLSKEREKLNNRRSELVNRLDVEREELRKKRDNALREASKIENRKEGQKKFTEAVKNYNEAEERSRNNNRGEAEKIWNDMTKHGKKENAAKETLSKFRNKIKSPEEANAAVAKMKGTKISPLKKSVYGSHSTAEKEYNDADKRSRERFARNDKDIQKSWNDRNSEIRNAKTLEEVDAINEKYNNLNRQLTKARNDIYRDDEKAKSKVFRKERKLKDILAKARPKIAERRQAVANYNKRENATPNGMAWLKRNSVINSSAGEWNGFVARDFAKGLNEGKTISQIHKEHAEAIKKHPSYGNADQELKWLDSFVDNLRKANK